MVKVIETEAGHGGYEQRYDLYLGNRLLTRVVRRPVSIAPPDGETVLVDDGPRYGTIRRRSAALYRDGKFKSIKWEPTHWSAMEKADG